MFFYETVPDEWNQNTTKPVRKESSISKFIGLHKVAPMQKFCRNILVGISI